LRKLLITLLSLMFMYLLWPYIAVFNLYIVLKTKDIAGVEKCIDWASFRKDFRSSLDNLVEVKLKENLDKREINFTFDSLTLAKEISDKIANPKGLIYLFNQPDKFIQQIRQIFKNTLPPEKMTPPIPEKTVFEIEGPNIKSLFDKIKYAFFTKPNRFRLSLNQGGLIFTLEWELKGFFWQLTRMKMPINKI